MTGDVLVSQSHIHSSWLMYIVRNWHTLLFWWQGIYWYRNHTTWVTNYAISTWVTNYAIQVIYWYRNHIDGPSPTPSPSSYSVWDTHCNSHCNSHLNPHCNTQSHRRALAHTFAEFVRSLRQQNVYAHVYTDIRVWKVYVQVSNTGIYVSDTYIPVFESHIRIRVFDSRTFKYGFFFLFFLI